MQKRGKGKIFREIRRDHTADQKQEGKRNQRNPSRCRKHFPRNLVKDTEKIHANQKSPEGKGIFPFHAIT